MAPMGSPDSPRIDAPKAPAERSEDCFEKNGAPYFNPPTSQGSSSNHHRKSIKIQVHHLPSRTQDDPSINHVSTTIEILGVHRYTALLDLVTSPYLAEKTHKKQLRSGSRAWLCKPRQTNTTQGDAHQL